MSTKSERANRASRVKGKFASSRASPITWWHTSALRMFRDGGNTVGIARALNTTEADAYNLLAQAREAARGALAQG